MGCSCTMYRMLEEFMFYDGSLSGNNSVNVYLFTNCKGLQRDEFTMCTIIGIMQSKSSLGCLSS